MFNWKPICLMILAASLAGCGSGKTPPKMATVKGKVTIDAKPLASGSITFEGTDGSIPTVIDIKDGVYEGQTSVGEKIVRIMAFKTVPLNAGGMTGPEYENKTTEQNYLPARFNTNSTDKRVVKEGDANEFDFGVMSK